jgi:hypothetical protein
MTAEAFAQIRAGLLDSYKHRMLEGDSRCAICGATGVPLALHLVEWAQPGGLPPIWPDVMIPMSRSNTTGRGTLRGSFGFCSTCAPPCRRCALPIRTRGVREFAAVYEAAVAETGDFWVGAGVGECTHPHPLLRRRTPASTIDAPSKPNDGSEREGPRRSSSPSRRESTGDQALEELAFETSRTLDSPTGDQDAGSRLDQLRREVDAEFASDSGTWKVYVQMNPSAPVIAISRDPRSGPSLTPVFFIGAHDAETLSSVMQGLFDGTGGKARFRSQPNREGGTPLLIVPLMYHLDDPGEFSDAMQAYLEGLEGVSWFEEPCEVIIKHEGRTYTAVAGSDGSLQVKCEESPDG